MAANASFRFLYRFTKSNPTLIYRAINHHVYAKSKVSGFATRWRKVRSLTNEWEILFIFCRLRFATYNKVGPANSSSLASLLTQPLPSTYPLHPQGSSGSWKTQNVMGRPEVPGKPAIVFKFSILTWKAQFFSLASLSDCIFVRIVFQQF